MAWQGNMDQKNKNLGAERCENIDTLYMDFKIYIYNSLVCEVWRFGKDQWESLEMISSEMKELKKWWVFLT